MFHLAAYSVSLGQTANTDAPALPDSVLQITNNHFRLNEQTSLVGAAAMSATLLRARLDSPTLRIIGNPYILPPQVNATPTAEPRVMDLTRQPYLLPLREEIAMQATSGLAMGNETFFGLIWVRRQFTPVPPGRMQWVRVTSTTAAVAATWTQIALTFESSLPSGVFSVAAMRGVGAANIAYRLIVPSQLERPGVLAVVLDSNRQADMFIDGSLGEFGRFSNDNPPLCEVLSTTTTAAHTIYLGLVQVGSL